MTTLDEFVRKIDDLESQVILLAGKRIVAPEDEIKLVQLGELLAKWLPDCKFRSGNAKGSDELFIQGVCKVDPECVELILPFKGHRPETAKNLYALPLEDFDLAAEPEAVYQTRETTKGQIVDSYLTGKRDFMAMKAPYLIRDTIMVIGSEMHGLKKASFAIFYDDLGKSMRGGTGHTMRVCKMNEVDFINQETWMKWLK